MKKNTDWKLISDSYFDKAISLAVLITLFAFLVSPKFEVKPYKASKRVEVQAVEEPPEIKPEVKAPETEVKPVVEIVIGDDIEDEEDEDLEIVSTIKETSIDLKNEVAASVSTLGKTPRIVAYDEAPKPIKIVEPVYPSWARAAELEGKVVVNVEIFANGKVGAVEILKSLEKEIDQEAIKAVKQWEFKPAEQNGVPVACWVNFPITFGIEN